MVAEEVVVGLGEGLAAEEASVGTEGRGVWRTEDPVALGVDEACLLLRIRSPEDEDEMLPPLSEELYRPVREVLPAPAVVACLLYTSPSPRDKRQSRMPSSA